MAANLNKTECNCNGIWNAATETCDAIPEGVDACPNFWKSVAGWDWENISTHGLDWCYGLGLCERPDYVDNTLYMMELERQRRQTQYVMIGLIVIAIIFAVVLVSRKRGK